MLLTLHMRTYILDFLGAYCPKSRKERSVPHFEPVTCDDGVICSPRFVRRAECVAHTGKIFTKG